MKLLNKILILCFLLVFTSLAQNESIKLVFTSNFSTPFQQGKPWANVNENLVKTFIIDRVVADYAQFGISVSTTSGSLLAKIGINSIDSLAFGEAVDGFGSYIWGSAVCEIYSGSFSKHPEWQGTINANVDRIGEAISGTVSHELAHLINCVHAYMFNAFNPTISGAIDNQYWPKEPSELPLQITEDDASNHIMATSSYITFEQRATINRAFSSHSQRTINFAKNGGCNVDGNMTWGLFNKTMNQQNDITISSGVTLYISGNSYTHNLNARSISGGTVIQSNSATVSGLAAKVKSGSTVKGLFPTIQPAINFASSGNTIELVSATYSESPSISSKSNINLTGQGTSSTVLNNGAYISNSSNISVSNMRLNHTISSVSNQSVSVSNCYLPCATMLYDYYSSQNTMSNCFSGTEDQASYAVTSYGGTGTLSSNIIRRFDAGVFLTSSASYYIGTSNTFCNNGYDIYSPSPSSASAVSNNYSYALPNSVYGNVTTSGTNGVCSLPKTSALQQTEIASSDSKLLKEADYKYIELLRKIDADSKKEKYDKSKYEMDYNNLINDYMNVVAVEKDKQIVKAALTKLNYLYKAKEDKNTFTAYLNDLASKNNYKLYLPYIQRFSIWDNIEKSDYQNSISVADVVLKNANADEDLICEMLYEKGLVYKYYIKNQSKAEEMFGDVIANYPKHILAKFASQESGIELKEKFGIKATESEETVSYSLDNYPNPFNPMTTISYSLPEAGQVTLKVYDLLGREVVELVNSSKERGKHNVIFNASKFSSGFYIYTIRVNDFYASKKMLLTK